jgi:3',5'-cyclic AMP phosphodiesterase CpdA
MKQIVHLSDLHVGFRDLGDRLRDLVAHFIAELQPADNYVIVITGDLVEKPDVHAPYQETRDSVDALESAGFTVLMVPGNHDYNDGILLDKTFVPQFKEVFYGEPNLQYPKVDIVDSIAFIGLDSLAEELHWYDRMFADGELGDAQLQRLDNVLGDSTVASCRHRVVYLHHHPFTLVPLSELKDARKLRRVLQKHGNVDALLFGHHHLGRTRKNVWGIPRCYDGGTATGMRPGTVLQRILDLSQDPTHDFDSAIYTYEEDGL